MLMHAAILSGANYIWHVAGWLEAGLCASYAKFLLDCEQLGGWYKYAQGVDVGDLSAAMEAVREVGPAGHYLGTAHTLSKFESAFFMPPMMDFNSYEQWSAEGSLDAAQRALNKARSMLDNYQEPTLEQSKLEALDDFIAKRQTEIPASVS
jgi:trimethylamine--corrinoid protein Co-methyltransferase